MSRFMYKLRNVKTKQTTVVHLASPNRLTAKKAAVSWHRPMRNNKLEDWKVINYSSSGSWDYPDED